MLLFIPAVFLEPLGQPLLLGVCGNQFAFESLACWSTGSGRPFQFSQKNLSEERQAAWVLTVACRERRVPPVFQVGKQRPAELIMMC